MKKMTIALTVIILSLPVAAAARRVTINGDEALAFRCKTPEKCQEMVDAYGEIFGYRPLVRCTQDIAVEEGAMSATGVTVTNPKNVAERPVRISTGPSATVNLLAGATVSFGALPGRYEVTEALTMPENSSAPLKIKPALTEAVLGGELVALIPAPCTADNLGEEDVQNPESLETFAHEAMRKRLQEIVRRQEKKNAGREAAEGAGNEDLLGDS